MAISFQDKLLFIYNHPYIKAILMFLLFILIAKLILVINKTIITRFTKKTKTKLDDIIIRKTERTISYVVILIGLKVSLAPLTITNRVFSNSLDTVIILVIAYIIIEICHLSINFWSKRVSDKGKIMKNEIVPLLESISKISVLCFTLIIILKAWDVQVGAVLASFGIIGIVFGFAMQDSLKNVFGGISLMMDQTYGLNDVIQLESGELGKVLEVGLRSTKIRTYDNEILIVPNGQLSNMRIINFAKPNKSMRLKVGASVEYGSDVDKVKKVMRGSLKDTKEILKYPAPEVRFTEMADFALKFEILFFIEKYQNRFKIKNQVTTKIYKALKENKIKIPFPTRTVYLKK